MIQTTEKLDEILEQKRQKLQEERQKIVNEFDREIAQSVK